MGGRVFFNANLNWYLGQPQEPLTFWQLDCMN
jgi:hypothetical protein